MFGSWIRLVVSHSAPAAAVAAVAAVLAAVVILHYVLAVAVLVLFAHARVLFDR